MNLTLSLFHLATIFLEFYVLITFKCSSPTLCNFSQYNVLPYHPNEIPLTKNIVSIQIQWAVSVLPLADLSALLDIVNHTLFLENLTFTGSSLSHSFVSLLPLWSLIPKHLDSIIFLEQTFDGRNSVDLVCRSSSLLSLLCS